MNNETLKNLDTFHRIIKESGIDKIPRPNFSSPALKEFTRLSKQLESMEKYYGGFNKLVKTWEKIEKKAKEIEAENAKENGGEGVS